MKSWLNVRGVGYIICGLVLFGSILSAKAAGAAVYYVAKTGSDGNSCAQAQSASTPKLSIANGATCLNPGDTLIIKAGTYQENAPPIPSGTSGAVITVKANPGNTVIIQPPGDGANGWYISNKHYITFDGLTWDAGLSPGAGGLVKITDTSTNLTFQNCELNGEHTPILGFLIVSGTNDRTDGTGSITVRNCKVHGMGTVPDPGGTGKHGFYIEEANNLIEGNEVYDNSGYGIQFYNGYVDGATAIHDNILRSNYFHDNNREVGNPGGEIDVGGHDNQIYNNIIANDPYAGIRIQYTSPTSNKIYNNTIYNTGQYGIYLEGSSHTVQNNIVYTTPAIVNSSSRSIVSSNLLYPTDPMFVNAGAGDFRLQSNSPAIDTGMTLSQVPNDYAGISRPQRKAFDIGAYEYGGGLLPAPTNLRIVTIK